MSSASVDQEKLDRAQEALWIKQIKDAYEYLKAGKNEKYQQSRDEATHTVRLFLRAAVGVVTRHASNCRY